MCGRFVQCTSGAVLAARFQLPVRPDLTPRYNVAPGQPISAVPIAGASGRKWVALRWGLVRARVIPTNEELMIALHVRDELRAA